MSVRLPPASWDQRLFHMAGKVRAANLLRGFEHDARRARAVNDETLRRILTRNSNCEIGRRYGFSTLARKPGAFRGAVPLVRWADVAADVDRVARGERGVLCSEPVIFFSLSSGTTGASKYIPNTASSFAFQRRYYTGLCPAVPATRVPFADGPYQGITLLSAAGATQRTAGGIPVALASANGLSRVKRIVPYLWTSPWTVFEVADLDASWYLHALFGLRARTAKFLNAVFAPHLVAWVGFVQARFEVLLRDLADGSISADLHLTVSQRSALEAALRPDPSRAAEVERAAAPGFDGFVRRAWPFLRYASAVITGPFAAALPRLRGHLGDLPIYTTCLSASEGMLGLNIDLDRPEHYVLCNGCAYFEFIPVDQADRDQPSTCTVGEVQEGECYELSLTNYAGLYRYRLGDVVEVVGFHHEAPVMAFRYRMGSVIDLVGEKTSEEQALAAVKQVVGEAGLVDYAAFGDALATPPRYVVFIEASEDHQGSISSDRLDAALSTKNPAYAAYRAGGHRLGPPTVRIVRTGAFRALEQRRLVATPGLARNQLKTPRRIADDASRRFLEEAADG
jgi:GH3 auxin-responsive promoter